MTPLHRQLAFTMVLFYAVLGIWGVGARLLGKPMDSGYRGALVIAEGLGIVQALVGLALLVTGGRPADALHFLYGLSVVVTLPLVQQYLAGKRWSPTLSYGLGCLFMMGLAIRAITTATATG